MNWEWLVCGVILPGLLYGIYRAITAPHVNGHATVYDDAYHEEYNSHGERKV